jgi:branched-chain amino acid transport system permease protein
MLGGSIGVFFASYATFVSPESFSFMESVMVLAMVVIGGMGTIEGPVIGALILVFLPEALRSVSDYRMLIFGALMVFMMIVMPRGFMGWIKPRRILKTAEEEASLVNRDF